MPCVDTLIIDDSIGPSNLHKLEGQSQTQDTAQKFQTEKGSANNIETGSS